MGMESVTAVAFQKEIEETFGISIDDTATFDYPNLSDLSAYVSTLIATNDVIEIDTTLFSEVLFKDVPDDIAELSIDDVVKRLENVI